MYLTYFYRFNYLCAKNYQIWWRFDEVLTKTSWVIFAHPVYIVIRHSPLLKCTSQPDIKTKIIKNSLFNFKVDLGYQVINVSTPGNLVSSACCNKQQICVYL